jgi:hypothetical protein
MLRAVATAVDSLRRGALRRRGLTRETADLMRLFVLKYCVWFTFTYVKSGQGKSGRRNADLCVVRTLHL